MSHRAAPEFWEAFATLPPALQALARRNFQLLQADHSHPSLHFKHLGRGYWSARVGRSARAVAIKEGVDWVWIWIGLHDEYEERLR